MTDPLILTAAFAAPDQAWFDALRRAHFPAHRNHIPAHLTLFHHLPGADMAMVAHCVQTACDRHPFMQADVDGLRSLGRGVAFTLQAPALAALRATLAGAFHGMLTAQDRQGWRAHVTVQNKVDPPAAAALLQALRAEFVSRAVTIEGLLLWRYRGGPWDAVDRYPFQPAPD